MSIEKDFIPYNEALALKELGFNEPCFAVYFGNGSNELLTINPSTSKELTKKMVELGHIPCPTFSQAFRFFREKYGLIFCNDYGNNLYFYWIISKDEEIFFNNEDKEGNVITYKTYEQAELECLRKLIEIVKQ